MKKNKYIVFVAIGFELVAMILAAIYLGKWLEDKGYGGAQAILIVIGFFVWFASLMLKLKAIKND